MLVKLTVESNNQKKSDVGSRIFNTDYLLLAKTVQTTKTEFSYNINPRDRRSLPIKIVSTEGIATIKTAFGATWQTNYVDMPIFPDNDSTATAVAHTIAKESLVYAIPDPASTTTRSYLYVLDGAFKVRKLLVDYNLDQIIDIADSGATSTTTTTTA